MWGDVFAFMWDEATKDRFSYVDYLMLFSGYLVFQVVWQAIREARP
jgi:hypothetical protein